MHGVLLTVSIVLAGQHPDGQLRRVHRTGRRHLHEGRPAGESDGPPVRPGCDDVQRLERRPSEVAEDVGEVEGRPWNETGGNGAHGPS